MMAGVPGGCQDRDAPCSADNEDRREENRQSLSPWSLDRFGHSRSSRLFVFAVGPRMKPIVAFYDEISSIHIQWPDVLNSTRGPTNFDLVHFFGRADTHKQTRIGCRQVAAAAFSMADYSTIAHLDGHPRANCIPIAFGPLKLQPQPMIRRLRIVVQEHGVFAAIVDRQVHIAIIVVVATCQAASYVMLLKIIPNHFGNVLKSSSAVIEVQLGLLPKSIVGIIVLI